MAVRGGRERAQKSEVGSQGPAVPEPTTMLASALLLLPFGASTIRFLRQNRAA